MRTFDGRIHIGRVLISRLVLVAAVLVAMTPQRAGANEGDVEVVDEPPSSCDSDSICVVDVDVAVPPGVAVPGGDRPGNRVRVILPSGYSDDAAVRHPLLLLLHGAGDGSESWTEKSDVEVLVADLCRGATAERCPVVVMPDGGGKHSETGWYTDWHDGSRQWESFHIEGVLPWAAEQLAVGGCRESTIVAGLSMGGFGAFSYAARHPDRFVAAASFSGFLDIRPAPPLSTVGFRVAQGNGLGAPTEEMFGPAGLAVEEDGWSAHNPTDLARAGAYRAFDGNLWLATGTGTPGGPAGDDVDDPRPYAVESFIFDLTQNFRVAMAQADTPFHDQSYVGGNHTWPYWQRALRLALPEMLDVVRPCPSAATTPIGTAGAGDAAAAPPTQSEGSVARTGSLPATGSAMLLGPAMAVVLAGLALRRPRRT